MVRTSKIPMVQDAEILYKKIIEFEYLHFTMKKARAMKEILG